MLSPKESQLYLQFFKQNKMTLLAPIILGASLGFVYSQNLPVRYQHSVLLEMEYSSTDIPQKSLLTDEAVTLLRSVHITEELSIEKSPLVRIYKPGPVSLVIETVDSNLPRGLKNNEVLSKYAVEHFPVHQKGTLVKTVVNRPLFLFTIVAAGIGALLGILISLLKTYLRNF